MAESHIPPERTDPTPADKFEAWLREADAREAACPVRFSRAGGWVQRTALLFVSLCLWAVILLGLSRSLLGWP